MKLIITYTSQWTTTPLNRATWYKSPRSHSNSFTGSEKTTSYHSSIQTNLQLVKDELFFLNWYICYTGWQVSYANQEQHTSWNQLHPPKLPGSSLVYVSTLLPASYQHQRIAASFNVQTFRFCSYPLSDRLCCKHLTQTIKFKKH